MSTQRTNDCGLSAAAICRKYGWSAGTRLSGVERGGRDYIRITAVGMNDVLAYWESDERERPTSLSCRNWREETPAASAPVPAKEESR